MNHGDCQQVNDTLGTAAAIMTGVALGLQALTISAEAGERVPVIIITAFVTAAAFLLWGACLRRSGRRASIAFAPALVMLAVCFIWAWEF